MSIATYRLYLGDDCLVINCASHLIEQVEFLLKELKQYYHSGKKIYDGLEEPFGWSKLSFHKRGSNLVVCEPDFWGDPFNNLREDLTCTLTIFAKQSNLLKKLHISNERPPMFCQRLSVSKSCFSSKRIYLQRKTPTYPEDSGWSINPLDSLSAASPETQSLYVYQLLDYRQEVLQVLALPAKYIVTFELDRIEKILNEADQDVWNNSKIFAL